MLAANIVGKEQVDIEIISLNQQADWLSEENLEEQLRRSHKVSGSNKNSINLMKRVAQ